MPTEAEHRVHVPVVADCTKHLLLVGNIEIHDPLSMAQPLLPATGVDVASLGVHHCALTVGLVVVPVAGVGVSAGVVHGAIGPCFTAAAEGPVVSGAGETDVGAVAVRATIGEGNREVWMGEMRTRQMICVIDGVVVAQEKEAVVERGNAFTSCFKSLNSRIRVSSELG